nr:RNA-directed DNA polymerase, eukaryota [Tanacetum cinerariifolium]
MENNAGNINHTLKDNLPEQAFIPSGDLFGIDDLIFKPSKVHKADIPEKVNTEPEFPPSFTPLNSNHEATVSEHVANNNPSVQSPKEASNNVFDEGTWMATNSDLLFISVYSPQELTLKRVSWVYMADDISRWHGEVVVMRDFNEFRYASERHGSIFHASNAAKFNMFIANSHLNDIPLGGVGLPDDLLNRTKIVRYFQDINKKIP